MHCGRGPREGEDGARAAPPPSARSGLSGRGHQVHSGGLSPAPRPPRDPGDRGAGKAPPTPPPRPSRPPPSPAIATAINKP